MFAQILLPTLTEETIVKFGNQMVLNKEFFCMMPVSMLIELPKIITGYLSKLRQEWFVLFDRVAEYQHTDSVEFEEVSKMFVLPKRKKYTNSIYNDSQPVIQKPPSLPKNETISKIASTPELALLR
jgi:hypothetical protein